MDGAVKRLLVPVLLAALAAVAVAFLGSWILAIPTGLIVLAIGLFVEWSLEHQGVHDPSRRSFLLGAAGLGVLMSGAGSVIGRFLRRATLPDPTPVMDEMATAAGSEYMEILMRTHHPGRSGELQLMLAPYNSSNYANESQSLAHDDPRTSHASVWMYLERIPLAVYAPGFITPGSSTQRVTLADIAPTMASFMGFGDWATNREGKPLPEIAAPSKPPKVIVVFVIDGGGWNVLNHWPDAWPYLKELHSKSMLYRNAIHGSFPAVTACAHATIGTGTFPRDHGITGHNIRVGDEVRKTYGPPGRAMPSDILLPTLSDLWSEKTNNEAWVGEIGYQIWHLGMLGHGREPGSAQKPVAIYFDEMHTHEFQPQNPQIYRMPLQAPPISVFQGYWEKYWSSPSAPPPNINDPVGRQVPCCSPPIIKYQGDIISNTLKYEPIGRTGTTDLLYINYKSPDYTGHVYNFLDPHEQTVLLEVDAQLRRLVDQLEAQYGEDFALIVTADHGQCPLPDKVDGVRLDPIQLQDAIAGHFGGGPINLVQYVAPSEVFLSRAGLWDAGIKPSDIGAFLKNYRYDQNIGWYVQQDAIEEKLLNKLEFTGVFGQDYLDTLVNQDLSRFGETSAKEADPNGIAPADW
jgi:Type I phosphodiesterase / nucleotide pyrophosphatase